MKRKGKRTRAKPLPPAEWVAMQLTWYEVIKYGDRRPLDEYPEDLDFCGPSGSADGVWKQTDKRPSPFEEGTSTYNSPLARCAQTGHKPSTKALDRYASPFDKPRPCRTSESGLVGAPKLSPRLVGLLEQIGQRWAVLDAAAEVERKRRIAREARLARRAACKPTVETPAMGTTQRWKFFLAKGREEREARRAKRAALKLKLAREEERID